MAVHAAPVKTGPMLVLPTWARAIALLTAWLPFAWMVLVVAPRFAPIFARLEPKVGLPTLSRLCMWFARLTADTGGLNLAALVAVVVGLDWLAVRTAQRIGRSGWYWVWFTTLAGLGVVASLVILFALILPVNRMGSLVES
jgi:hypothetical protein